MSELVSHTECWKILKDNPYSNIRLKDSDGIMIVPFPSKSASLEKRNDQIKKYLDSENTPDGIYIIEYGTSRTNPKRMQVKKDTTGSLEDAKPIEFDEKKTRRQIEQDVMTNADIVDLRVDYEKCKLEKEALEKENKDLKEQIEELEECLDQYIEEEDQQLLEGNENNGNSWGWLKDVAPSFLDAYFENEREKNEIKRAEIGLRMNGANKSQQQPKEEVQYPEQNKESILEFKRKYPHLWDNFYKANKIIIDQILDNDES